MCGMISTTLSGKVHGQPEPSHRVPAARPRLGLDNHRSPLADVSVKGRRDVSQVDDSLTNLTGRLSVRLSHQRPLAARPSGRGKDRMISKIKVGKVTSPHSDGPHTGSGLSMSRGLKYGLLAVGVFFLGLIALYGFYNLSHSDRVYNGVRVLGAQIGGQDAQAARATLQSAGSGFPANGVTVSAAGKTWQLTPADLGAGLDVEKTLASALRVGRDGGLSSLGTLFSETRIEPIVAVDTAKIDAAVTRISSELDKPAVDSKLQKGEDGTYTVTPSSTGTVVDRAALRDRIVASMLAGGDEPVAVTMAELPPAVTEEALKASEAQARLVTGRGVKLQYGKKRWEIEPHELRNLLAVQQQPDGTWSAALDQAKLTEYMSPVAEKFRVAPVDAGIVFGKDKVSLREEEAGLEVDMAPAIAAIVEASTAESEEGRVVTLPMKEIPAAVHTDQVRPVFAKLEGLVTNGLRLHYADDGYILRNASAIGFLDVAPTEGGPGALKIVVDEGVLAKRISGVALNFNRPPSDASFKMVDGAPKRISAGRDGIKVDVDATLKKALDAINSYGGGERLQVELAVDVTKPQIGNADIADIKTPDLIGSGETSYAGSSAERAHNVELGASKINGTLVPPGGVFSTNDAVGDLTLDAGYKMGYMIIRAGDEIKTIPAEAGGICQVSTTLFHSVFWGGLEVVERNWHSYWIASYGVAPTGLPGLDSTIAPPEKDFRFRNNTGNWILIRASASKGKLTFKIYGVNPGWKVKVGDPVITNRVKTDPAPIREETDKLPKGREVKVENAQDGFNASITRTVLDKDGNVVDKWTANSRYAPARNRYLIGTGPAPKEGAGGEKKP
jgi:vancomycin resistance protein YoaR